MKILQINAVYGFGSTGLVVRDIEQEALRNGMRTDVAYQFANEKPENGFRIGNRLDWKWHALYARVSGKEGYAGKTATRGLIGYLKRESPDVVHLHNLHSNYVNLPMLLDYLAESGVHTVVTLHDCWFFTGKCHHFVAADCGRWRAECGRCPLKKSAPASWFFDRSSAVLKDRIRLFQKIGNLTVVGCSDWICGLAGESPVFRGKRIVRIYNGIDTDVFRPLDRDLLRRRCGVSGQFVILVMANKFFAPGNSEVRRRLTGGLAPEERLLVVGCGREQREMLGNIPGVMARGFISDRGELAELYNVADVFLNLTLADTLPTVNMESICCGTPVVTYDSCGSPELVTEGKTGSVIPCLDYEMLRKAIENVKRGRFSREVCSEAGKSAFDKNLNYRQYIKLYQDIVS